MIDESVMKELQGLSEKEREYALKILNEFADNGDSKLYNELVYSEYKEVPVDILTFIKDNSYLGKAWHTPEGKCKLFPYWEKRLTELFPTNVDTDYNTFIESGARGLGKSEIAVTVMLYLMYRLMCLKNPYLTYNLKVTEKFCFGFMNITKELAESIGVSKFQETVQMSPWFMARGTMTGRTNLMWNPPDFIDIIIGSQSSDVIGKPIFACFFDEVSFQRNKSVEEQKKKALDMIDTALGGMKTRFTNRGKNPTLLVLASSKRSEKSFLEEHIKKKAETDAIGTLVVDEPVWNVRPASEYSGERFWVAQGNRFMNSEVLPKDISETELDIWRGKGYKLLSVPVEYYAKFYEDIDRALCDYAGISSSDLTTYISGVRLMDCVNKDIKNPFTMEVLKVGNGPNDYSQYYDFFDLNQIPLSLRSRPLFIHLDLSVSGDKTGIAGVWIVHKKHSEEGVPESKELFFRLAFSVSIEAPKGYQISFEKTRQFIYWLKNNGFNIRCISSDTYAAPDMKQSMISHGYNYELLSVDRVSPTDHVCLPYQYFKSTIYEKRIELYPTKLLTDEIVGLERNEASGKIDHSVRGINSKDQCDAVCGAVYMASQFAEEFAFDYGETIDIVKSVNAINGNLDSQRAQINIDFEKELMKSFGASSEQSNFTNIDSNQPTVFFQDGIIVW